MKKELIALLKYGAITGNIIFILWILYNAIDNGFRGTLPEKISSITLIALLIVNNFFLIRKQKESNQL